MAFILVMHFFLLLYGETFWDHCKRLLALTEIGVKYFKIEYFYYRDRLFMDQDQEMKGFVDLIRVNRWFLPQCYKQAHFLTYTVQKLCNLIIEDMRIALKIPLAQKIWEATSVNDLEWCFCLYFSDRLATKITLYLQV